MYEAFLQELDEEKKQMRIRLQEAKNDIFEYKNTYCEKYYNDKTIKAPEIDFKKTFEGWFPELVPLANSPQFSVKQSRKESGIPTPIAELMRRESLEQRMSSRHGSIRRMSSQPILLGPGKIQTFDAPSVRRLWKEIFI